MHGAPVGGRGPASRLRPGEPPEQGRGAGTRHLTPQGVDDTEMLVFRPRTQAQALSPGLGPPGTPAARPKNPQSVEQPSPVDGTAPQTPVLKPYPQSDCTGDRAGEEGIRGNEGPRAEPRSLSGEEEPTRRGDGRPEARKKALTRDRAVGSFTPDHPAPRTVRNEPEPPSWRRLLQDSRGPRDATAGVHPGGMKPGERPSCAHTCSQQP